MKGVQWVMPSASSVGYIFFQSQQLVDYPNQFDLAELHLKVPGNKRPVKMIKVRISR